MTEVFVESKFRESGHIAQLTAITSHGDGVIIALTLDDCDRLLGELIHARMVAKGQAKK